MGELILVLQVIWPHSCGHCYSCPQDSGQQAPPLTDDAWGISDPSHKVSYRLEYSCNGNNCLYQEIALLKSQRTHWFVTCNSRFVLLVCWDLISSYRILRSQRTEEYKPDNVSSCQIIGWKKLQLHCLIVSQAKSFVWSRGVAQAQRAWW